MSPYVPNSPLELAGQSFFNSPSFYVGLFLMAFVFLAVVFLFIYRAHARRNYKLPAKYHQVVLLVSMPKEALSDKEGGNVNSIEKIREQISWAENLWAQVGGLKAEKGFKVWLYGRHDHISLEIVAHQKVIYFYIAVPKYLQAYLEQQLQAQYSYAQVEEVPDYNIFSPAATVVCASVKLEKQNMLQIKTYKEFDADPLNSLTNILSKLGSDDSAAIQFVVRSAHKKWRTVGLKIAAAMQQGKSLRDALKANNKDLLTILSKGYNAVFSQEDDKKKDQDKKDGLTPGSYRLSAKEEELVKKIQEKSSKAGLDVNIRVVITAQNLPLADAYLANVLNSFAQYNVYEFGNAFKVAKNSGDDKNISAFIHRIFNDKNGFVLNTEELASVFHFPLPSCETPNIHWLGARKAAAPINIPTEGIVIGKNIFRGGETLIRMKQEDRMRHTYIIGMTGAGKSVLMEEMAKQDIAAGRGVCFIDPHGTAIDRIMPCIPKERLEDVIYLDPSDTERPIGLNMLEAKTQQEMDFATSEMISIFYKLLPDPAMAGPMFEHYMRNALLALMADQDDPGTLVELGRIFTDEDYRKKKLHYVRDILVKDFWEREYTASQRGSMASDMLSYVISKTGRFVENEMMRNIIGQSISGFNFRQVMDEGKILLVNLSKGKIGETNSSLLGLIIVSKLQMAAMARADLPEEKRKDFMLYIDEFQNYTTDSMAIILAEARKYRLALIMAHQYITQLVKGQDTSIRDAVFGNVGSMIIFRIGVEDAEVIAKQFAPVFNQQDLINIEKRNAYVRLLIDGTVSRPFNMESMPWTFGDEKIVTAIRELSRLKYGRPKNGVEAEIIRRSKIGALSKAALHNNAE